MNNVQAVRGMNDILPAESLLWQSIEQAILQTFSAYGYQEIRLPLLEKTELFKRGIGEATDIVEKEMYTFLDRNNESLTLRPEGTASCVRAAIQHGLLYNQQQKLWYRGPMFRYERPQKGRYRQFYQIGAEAFNFSGYGIEAELILMTARLWKTLGITKYVTLHLNSLGTTAVRQHYRDKFVEYCNMHIAELDEDSQRRLTTNPLRILDSKNPEMQLLLQAAPKITDYLDEQSKADFTKLCQALDDAGVQYYINPRLVRGLDYYTGTVFEWITEALGAQGAVCAGGRYDQLVESLGGSETPAIGFALGIERIAALLAEEQSDAKQNPQADIFIVLAADNASAMSLTLSEQLHDAFPMLKVWVNHAAGSFKSQFKRADKSGARYALIIGEDELHKNVVTCKNLRDDVPQITVSIAELIDYLRSVYK